MMSATLILKNLDRKLDIHCVRVDAAGAPSLSLSQCCHSDAHPSRRSNSSTELAKVDYTDPSSDRDDFLRGLQALLGRAAAERCSMSVKSDEGKGRSVSLPVQPGISKT